MATNDMTFQDSCNEATSASYNRADDSLRGASRLHHHQENEASSRRQYMSASEGSAMSLVDAVGYTVGPFPAQSTSLQFIPHLVMMNSGDSKPSQETHLNDIIDEVLQLLTEDAEDIVFRYTPSPQ